MNEIIELQTLELKSKLFEAIVLDSDDAIISKTLDGIITSWNNGAETIFGYMANEMIGRPMAVLFPPGCESEEDNILEQIKRGEKVDHFETVRLGKDGALVNVSVTISPIRDNNGTVVGASKIARNITRRKLLEQQLATSTEQIEDLYNHAPCGYHSLNQEGVFININNTELEWLGYDRESVIGKMKVTDFFTPESQKQFKEQFPLFMAVGHIEDLEFDLIGKDGRLRQVSMSATAIKDNDGNFLKSRTVLYEITELKKVQNQLTQLTIEQHLMLDNELVGIVKLKDRRAIWNNIAMGHMFGYDAGELIGQSSRILYPDDSSYKAMGAAAYPILNLNGVYRTQVELQRKDGAKIWVDVSGVKLTDNVSLWMMLDITALKQHQHNIERIAYHDILTGLPNRLLVADRLKQALAQAERNHQSLAICYLDLDGFKPINDQFGHAAGDKLLLEIAKRMQATVRANDTVGHLGGDEFVLLLTNLESTEEYQFVLQRVIDEINKAIVLDDSVEVTVGASIGVTVFPSDDVDSDKLIRHADQAMYKAKRSGRNRICLYDKADHE